MHPISIYTEQEEQAKKSFTHFYHLTHFLDQNVGTTEESWKSGTKQNLSARNKGLFDENKTSYCTSYKRIYSGKHTGACFSEDGDRKIEILSPICQR